MPTLTATLIGAADEVLLELGAVHLDISSGHGLPSWSGSFDLPANNKLRYPDVLNYRIRFPDGRIGQIAIRRFKVTASGAHVVFQGSGPIE